MRPPFESFRPQARPHTPQQQQQPQQNNRYSSQHQHNVYGNPAESNQLGMMSNPMMGHMNMPVYPQFFNNPSNMPQQQQQQQFHQFALPSQFYPSILGNPQFPAANNNLMGAQPNYFQHYQPQLNPFNSHTYPPVPNQYYQFQPPPPPISEPRPHGNDFQNNFTNHQQFQAPRQRFQRPQLHQENYAKRKSGFNKDHMDRGHSDNMGSDAGKEKKRSTTFSYTSKEIQQWREARRENYPTTLNIEKKSASDYIPDEEANMRRQQMMEVLAKQAELGVEVAEVPSHYKRKRDGGDKDKLRKKRRFQEIKETTRKPTLLEKLLSADIKRDKIQLLQVFRFMVLNSFFKEFPEQPLKFPLITLNN